MNSASSDALAPAARAETRSATLESERVETLRGAACMLLVAYHVIGNNATMGMHVADDSAFRAFANVLIHLRMPLFTFLSGFVYAYRPIRVGKELTFARKKLLRLFIPLLTLSTVYFLLQQYAPSVNSRPDWEDLPSIYYMPYAHFWFLQAIILIFALIGLIDRLGGLSTLPRYFVVLGLALAAHFLLHIWPSYFSSNHALYLLPFFIAGLGANRFREWFFNATALKWVALAVFVVTMTLHVLACYGIYGEMWEQRTPLATALSLSGLITLLYWTPPNRTLAWIGGFSFTVYLYHVFFTAGTRTALNMVGLSEPLPNFLIGCAVGIMGPIVVELVFRRSAFMRRFFLGQS
jgi:peptidoglycan/LPS O-acetylase OafA/YrhL